MNFLMQIATHGSLNRWTPQTTTIRQSEAQAWFLEARLNPKTPRLKRNKIKEKFFPLKRKDWLNPKHDDMIIHTRFIVCICMQQLPVDQLAQNLAWECRAKANISVTSLVYHNSLSWFCNNYYTSNYNLRWLHIRH